MTIPDRTKEAAMISYQWFLSPNQPFNKEELYKLQYCLYAAGIYLDLSWKDGSPVMTISVPEQAFEERAGTTMQDGPLPDDIDSCNGTPEDSVESAPSHKRGRPSANPKSDLTFGHVQHMRFMGISVEKIAKEIGVSKRTFYRRWMQAENKGLAPDTPFSQWTIS